MTTKSTTITLQGCRFHAHHGVLPQERAVGNEFEVTLTVHCPMAQAMEHDDLQGTINYAELYALVEREMAQPSRLLEHVAHRIITAVQAQFPTVTAGRLSIGKLHPPFKSQLAAVTVAVEW